MTAQEACRRSTLLLLGRDHCTYGHHVVARCGDRARGAISVGADVDSPAREYKGDLAVPNEDAALAIDEGDRVLLAVADAHFGHQSSHDLLRALVLEAAPVPANPAELERVLARVAAQPARQDYASETSFAVAVLDRREGRGFGWSFGDSSIALVGADLDADPLHRREMAFVSPVRPESLAFDRGHRFAFAAGSGEAMLAYTDGIDECHYRSPETSVTPALIRAEWCAAAGNLDAFLDGVVRRALRGVDGHPGGQDNIAILAAAV